MTATQTPASQSLPSVGALVAAIVTWAKSNVRSVAIAVIVGTVVGFIGNVWLLAFVYDGHEKVPPGGPAPGLNNEIVGTIFWILLSTVVFGLIGYFRAVGPTAFAETLRTRPAAVSALVSGGGNAAIAALLWGAMLSLLITIVVGPAIGAVLGVGVFATAFGVVGRLLTVIASRVVTAILRAVQPSAVAAPPSPSVITAGILGGSLAMVVAVLIPNDPFTGGINLKLIIAVLCGVAAFVVGRQPAAPMNPGSPVVVLLAAVGGLAVLDLLHPALVLANDGGVFECGITGVTDYVFGPCPGKETVIVLSGVGGVAAGFGAIPGLSVGNLLGTNPNWGPGIVEDTIRGGEPGEETPGRPGDEDFTETIRDAQGNVQRTVVHHTDPVTGDVTVTTYDPQGNVINTIRTHVDPVTGDVTITRTNSQGQPVVSQTRHVDPVTGDVTTTITNPQGTTIRTTTNHTDPITGDVTTTITNPQGTPIMTSTTHTDPITGTVTTTITNPQGTPIRTFTTSTNPVTGDVTRTTFNPQGEPIRTVIDHVNPVTGDTTRTTLNPQGTPIVTETHHTDPVTGDTTTTFTNAQGQPIRTETEHRDPVTGDRTVQILNPQGQPIGAEHFHTDPVTGDTTRTITNAQGQPIGTEITHTDPITGDTTRTILNEQGQPTRTEINHTDPVTGDQVTSVFNPQGQPIRTEVFHTDPVTGDTTKSVYNEQGQLEHSYTVHRDPITGLWVPDTAPITGSGGAFDGAATTASTSGPFSGAVATGAATAGQGVGGAGANVGGGLTGGGPGSGGPAVVPQTSTTQSGGDATGPGSGGPAVAPSTSSEGEQTGPAPAPIDPVLDGLTSAGTTTVPASDAFPTLHALVPDVGADGSVAGLDLPPPVIDNNSITVKTPLGPASAKLGVDDQGHLTATITDMPKDPTGLVLPSQAEANANLQDTVNKFNKLLDDKGVHIKDINTDGGKLTLIKEPNAPSPGPAPGSGG